MKYYQYLSCIMNKLHRSNSLLNHYKKKYHKTTRAERELFFILADEKTYQHLRLLSQMFIQDCQFKICNIYKFCSSTRSCNNHEYNKGGCVCLNKVSYLYPYTLIPLPCYTLGRWGEDKIR